MEGNWTTSTNEDQPYQTCLSRGFESEGHLLFSSYFVTFLVLARMGPSGFSLRTSPCLQIQWRSSVTRQFIFAHTLVKLIVRHWKAQTRSIRLVAKRPTRADVSHFQIRCAKRSPFTSCTRRVNEHDYQSLYSARLHSRKSGYLSVNVSIGPLSSSNPVFLVWWLTTFFRSQACPLLLTAPNTSAYLTTPSLIPITREQSSAWA
jgi:hypothetical protein